jgi:hypothetical protein
VFKGLNLAFWWKVWGKKGKYIPVTGRGGP